MIGTKNDSMRLLAQTLPIAFVFVLLQQRSPLDVFTEGEEELLRSRD